jgi:hypothetical protein
MEYDIEVRNHAGELSIGVEGDFDSDPAAINWAWYYLGKYRGDTAVGFGQRRHHFFGPVGTT